MQRKRDEETAARRAIVLTSGGLDSATVLAMTRADGFEITAVTFRYGQVHDVEVERASKVVRAQGVAEHLVLDLPLDRVGGSALLGDGDIPDEPAAGAGSGPIPVTYVPARNLIFLSMAVGVAEARSSRDIFIGVNAVDFSGYPDCRPEFIAAFRTAANLGTREGSTHGEPWFRVHMPLAELTKAQIIRHGTRLGVDFADTVSCYRADSAGRACGRCDACGLRSRGFAEAGVSDPTSYLPNAHES